ncbi:hypothetical protein [Sphingomonas jatrophae]|uniref:Uncharacterized protein n=1 Tax=Sphingomonas jatrophae TaxID=1166337 RepID=A0A1I6JLA4_9SPHN|nr:hypothetical protein [Sphingomonas jatrophae]SFR79719.1 hypothetical protein SAMN05192580_0443 [Sphingomonas jatrophae]
MSRDVRPLANVMAHDIWAVEFSHDRHLAKTAHFIATMAEARVASRAPAFVGHEALVCAGEAIQLQLAARAKLVELHERLQDVAGQVGVPEYAGSGGQKPEPGTPEPRSPRELEAA